MVSLREDRLKVGVLTPHAAAGPEVEIPDLSQGRVTVTMAQIQSPEDASRPSTSGPEGAEALRDLTRPEALDRATASLIDRSVEVVAHASTTTGYVLGARSEAALVERLAATCAVPVLASAAAAVEALQACGADRLVLVHPPWFDDELDQLGVGYFGDQGFDVRLLKATELPSDPSALHTAAIVDWVSGRLGAGHEAVFLAGNGFRAARAVAELEQRTGRLVLQANQVLLWAILAATGASMTGKGGGRLFETLPGSDRGGQRVTPNHINANSR